MAFIEVIIAVPATTAPSGAWTPSAITKILNVTPEGAAAGDTYYVYGSPNNTGTTAGKDAELVATIVVTSTETQVTLSTLVTNRPGPAFQYYAVTLGAGTGGGGKQVVVSGIDETAPAPPPPATVNQGLPNAGGPLAWPVAASQVGPWSVAATQGTSPWVTVTTFSAPQPVTQSGAWTVEQGTPPWSVVFPVAQHVIVDAVTSHVTVDQGTSPWVTSVSNFPASQQVTQGTSPWVVSGTATVSGTVTADQGTAAPLAGAWPAKVTDGVNGPVAVKPPSTAALATDPAFVVALSPATPLPAGTNVLGHVIIDSGSISATQGTSPWVVSGTVTANIGTTGGLALDATLTGGAAKAIVRGGTKGATVAADVTSTASGADHQALDVAIYDAAGNLLGTGANPLRVDPTGTTPQPVSGTVAVTQSTSPWVVSGTVTANQGTSPWVTSVSNFPASQQVTQGTSPWVVSGTVTANQGGAPWSVTIPTQALSASVTDASQATLVQAAITGRTEGGNYYQRASADAEGHLEVNVARPASAVGDLLVAEPTPLVQLLFTYGLNPDSSTTSVSGAATVTSASALAVVATGAAASSRGALSSRRYLAFRGGQGAQVSYAALYTAGVANSTQWGGIGTVSNALFFGYNGTAFGILIRTAGVQEIQTLTITTASTTNQNVTVTLEGVGKLVPVTNSGVITTTAREIAAADYSTTGSGWDAYQTGNTVVFVCRQAGNKVGVFSLTATTAVGAFAETTAGATPTESFVAQASWNVDKCNGAGGATNPSGINLDPTKINYYLISGNTNVGFFIQNSLNGDIVLVHEFRYVNNFTSSPLNNPASPVAWIVENLTNATNVAMSVVGGAAFTDGQVRLLGPKKAVRALKTGVTAAVPILTIRNNLTFNGVTNRAQMHVWLLSASSDGTRAVQVIYTINATLTGAVYQSVGAGSVADVDTTATASTGGSLLCTVQLGQTSDELLYPPKEIDFFLAPGETLTISATSAASADVGVSANWIEDQ